MAAAAMYRPPFIAAASFRPRTRGHLPLQGSRRSGDVGERRIDIDGFELLDLLQQRLRARAGKLEVLAEPLPCTRERLAIRSGVVTRNRGARGKQEQLQMLATQLRLFDGHDAASPI